MIETIPIDGRAEWLALRRRDLTASDVAAVAGVDPMRTPLRAYMEKLGLLPEGPESVIMRRGRWLEAATVEALRERYPEWDIRRAKVYLRDPDIRLGATPDAVATAPERDGVGIIQCKAVARPEFKAKWADGPPLKFELQTLTEAMLAGAAWCILAVLIVDTYGAELEVFEVTRHAGAEDRIRALAVQFWANVEAGRMPAPDYAEDSDLIDAMHPEVKRAWIDLAGDKRLPEQLNKRAFFVDVRDKAQLIIGRIDARVKHLMGDAEEGVLPGWKITWKEQERNGSRFRVLRVKDQRERDEGAF